MHFDSQWWAVGPYGVVVSWLQLYLRYQNCSYNRNTHTVPVKMLLCKSLKLSVYVTVGNKCLNLFRERKDCIIFAWVFEVYIAVFCSGLHGGIKSLRAPGSMSKSSTHATITIQQAYGEGCTWQIRLSATEQISKVPSIQKPDHLGRWIQQELYCCVAMEL